MTATDTKEAPAGQGEGFEIHNGHEEIEDSMPHPTDVCREPACMKYGERHDELLPMREVTHFALDMQGPHWVVDVSKHIDEFEGPGPWEATYTFDMQQELLFEEDELEAFAAAVRTAKLLLSDLTSKDVREVRNTASGQSERDGDDR